MAFSTPNDQLAVMTARFEREVRRQAAGAPPRRPLVITVARQLGSGGRRIAEVLASRLRLPLWDRQILDAVAGESTVGYSARVFNVLDEQSQSDVEALAEALLGAPTKDVYLHLLPRAILTIARQDAIILGRGAHLLLPEALRVRVEASVETRVRNLMRFEEDSEASARERIRKTDEARERFLRELEDRLKRRHPARERRLPYDLIINTDGFDVQQAANIVLTAASLRFGLSEKRVRPA
jgi:cytidylate kinase